MDETYVDHEMAAARPLTPKRVAALLADLPPPPSAVTNAASIAGMPAMAAPVVEAAAGLVADKTTSAPPVVSAPAVVDVPQHYPVRVTCFLLLVWWTYLFALLVTYLASLGIGRQSFQLVLPVRLTDLYNGPYFFL